MTTPIPSTAPAVAPRRLPRESLYIDSAPFWQGTRDGKLVLQACGDTGRFQHFPRPVSLATGSRNLQWREVSGNGSVYAVTALRTPGLGADGRLPCVLALIELEEGVRILGNLPASSPGDVRIGDRVKLSWDVVGDGRYPAFELVR
jgi:uncharacterized OB-fold protein